MFEFQDRRYVIFNVSELSSVDFSQVLETSEETVRKSLDGTKTFVKWNGETPNFVNNLTTKEGIYTLAEIWLIINGPEWTSSPPTP
jgi:hypothetical protein